MTCCLSAFTCCRPTSNRPTAENVRLYGENQQSSGLDKISEDHVNRIQVQKNQLLYSITCIDDIKNELYQNGNLTDMEMEDLTESPPLKACEKILILITQKPRHVYECFLESLISTEQHHVYQMLTFSDIEMNKQCFSEHSRAIRQNFTSLIKSIDPGALLDHLFQMKVITDRECEYINSKTGVLAMNESLLLLISRKSPEQFLKFKKALKSTNHEHVVEILEEWNRDDEEKKASMMSDIRNRRVVLPDSYKDKHGQIDARYSDIPMNRDMRSYSRSSSMDIELCLYRAMMTRSNLVEILSTSSRVQKKRSMHKLNEKLKELDDTLQNEVSIKLVCLESLDEWDSD